MLPTSIRDIQSRHQWSDETLLSVLANFVDKEFLVSTFEEHLEDYLIDEDEDEDEDEDLIDEDDLESEPTEPEEGDYTTPDHVRFYQYGKLAFTVAEDYGEDRWKECLRQHMDEQKFWPNVWFISDHGNAHLLNVHE